MGISQSWQRLLTFGAKLSCGTIGPPPLSSLLGRFSRAGSQEQQEQQEHQEQQQVGSACGVQVYALTSSSQPTQAHQPAAHMAGV